MNDETISTDAAVEETPAVEEGADDTTQEDGDSTDAGESAGDEAGEREIETEPVDGTPAE